MTDFRVAKHGELTEHNRWCEVCGHEHGPLYSCRHYPEELRAEIKRDTERFLANTASRAWWKRQAEANKWDQETLEFAMSCYGKPTED